MRVLILDPNRVIKTGNRFVTMGRRLNSYIEFRNVQARVPQHPDAFFIADEHAIVYRRATTAGTACRRLYEPAVARIYLSSSTRSGRLRDRAAEAAA